MTDVRLTATNPDDSSVVPVACNSRGELLITDPVIESIPNDVTIGGTLTLPYTRGQYLVEGIWSFGTQGQLTAKDDNQETDNVLLASTGYAAFRRNTVGMGSAFICTNDFALAVHNDNSVRTWQVGYDGTGLFNNLHIALEPDVSANYSVSKAQEDDEPSFTSYVGPVLDVAAELMFLRAQLRETMEKLKMVPEGGWEVWDGSD